MVRAEDSSAIEAIARATLLYDAELLDSRIPPEPAAVSLRARVCALGVGDEQAAERVIQRLLKGPGTLLEQLRWLCGAMAEMRRGLPTLRAGLLPRRLARIVSTDAIFLFYPNLNLPADETYGWPAVPLVEGGRTERLLHESSVETHIHLGGALPPIFYWLPLMGGGLHLETLRGLPATERGQAAAEDWQQKIGLAAWWRLWLAAFLERRWRGKRIFPWLEPAWTELPQLTEDAEPPKTADEARELVFDLDSDFRLRNSRYVSGDWPFPDPLRPARSDGKHHHYAAGERRFLYHLARLIADLELASPGDTKVLEGALAEYLRTRNAFHRLLVHDRGREGLLRFVQSFRRRGLLYGRRPRQRTSALGRRRSRLKRYLNQVASLERARMTAALDSQLMEPFACETGLDEVAKRRIEVRVSVPRIRDFRPTLWAWMKGLHDHLEARPEQIVPRSQVGFVFHFIKQGAGTEQERAAIDAADRLEWALRTMPWFRRFAVGVDAAGKERGSPPRVFLPAFFQIRKFQTTFRPPPGEPEVRLGFTYHVGEDVDDLLTGLRHVDETIGLLLPRDEGGRLGHALALGESVDRFYGRRQVTEPMLGTHLLDLVWAWGRLIKCGDGALIPWLQSRFQQLCGVDDLSPRKCFDSMCLDQPLLGTSDLHSEKELLEFLCPGLAERVDLTAPSPVPLRGGPWLQLIETLQENLCRRVAHRRICVEANPTSNLLIGDYEDYGDLPYRRLVDAGIAVSLNTDDPGLLMTSLPGELAAMYDALSERGDMGHREILAWLQERLFDAEQSTYLGRQVPTGQGVIEEIGKMPWVSNEAG